MIFLADIFDVELTVCASACTFFQWTPHSTHTEPQPIYAYKLNVHR